MSEKVHLLFPFCDKRKLVTKGGLIQ